MTLNNKDMGMNKICVQLDPARKIKIKIDTNGKILFVNNYFTEITKMSVSDIILKDISFILDDSIPKMISTILLDAIENGDAYLIFKGKISDGSCYWAFVKTTTEYNQHNEVKGYLLEVKMLPSKAISKMEKLYDILAEIEKNAGVKAAEKYFYGYIEDKGMTPNNFIFNIAEVDEKSAQKYFEIDEDAPVKKKKRSWF